MNNNIEAKPAPRSSASCRFHGAVQAKQKITRSIRRGACHLESCPTCGAAAAKEWIGQHLLKGDTIGDRWTAIVISFPRITLPSSASWHAQRAAKDVTVEMTTGGGKTLVGLLIAQSLVNETQGKVLYVCPTKQLVEQTQARAAECGIQVTTYHGGQWTAETHYEQGAGPCLTNYDAVFNGRSIFRHHDLQGIVFDDAHVAQNRIRAKYTLSFERGTPNYTLITGIFRQYYARNNQTQEFDEVVSGNSRGVLLYVPMFEVVKSGALIQRKLAESGIASDDNNGFSWEYLKDKVARCVIIISASRVEVTPYLLPVHDLSFFTGTARRVYLTATVPSEGDFIRTFGVTNPVHVKPGGKSGEAQRQFHFMVGQSDDEQRAAAKALIEPHKACIIAPSDRVAASWCPPGTRFDTTQGHRTIEEFREARDARKLVLSARYDGIDLPGDSCRVLVLDGLPKGEALIDTFMEQGLQIEALRAMRMATRITQALGRIFRSNNDHGAVVVCGTAARNWMSDPRKQAFMPRLLQQQVQLGLALREQVTTKSVTNARLLDGVLTGAKDWDALYDSHVGAFDATDHPSAPAWVTDLTLRERQAFEKVWSGNFAQAALEYEALAEEASRHDVRYSAWLRHLQGWAYQLAGNEDASTRAYVLAANLRAELGRPLVKRGQQAATTGTKTSPQAQRASAHIFNAKRRVADRINSINNGLKYGEATAPVEQALADLGELLGLEASRPDNADDKGPDVLWLYPEVKAGVGYEAKTGKKANGNYNKEDVGQAHNHEQWARDQHPGFKINTAWVGRLLPVTDSASPSPDLSVIPLEQFIGIVDRYQQMVRFIQSTCQPEEGPAQVEIFMRDEGLLWPDCVVALKSTLAVDLQRGEAS